MVQFQKVTKYLPSCLVVGVGYGGHMGLLFEDKTYFLEDILVCMYIYIYDMNNCHSSKKRTAKFWW